MPLVCRPGSYCLLYNGLPCVHCYRPLLSPLPHPLVKQGKPELPTPPDHKLFSSHHPSTVTGDSFFQPRGAAHSPLRHCMRLGWLLCLQPLGFNQVQAVHSILAAHLSIHLPPPPVCHRSLQGEACRVKALSLDLFEDSHHSRPQGISLALLSATLIGEGSSIPYLWSKLIHLSQTNQLPSSSSSPFLLTLAR